MREAKKSPPTKTKAARVAGRFGLGLDSGGFGDRKKSATSAATEMAIRRGMAFKASAGLTRSLDVSYTLSDRICKPRAVRRLCPGMTYSTRASEAAGGRFLRGEIDL
jgi:hypothetical protein